MFCKHIEDALQVLRGWYHEAPALRLTPRDASAMLNLDQATTLTLLQALQDSRFLELAPDGRFRKLLTTRVPTIAAHRAQRPRQTGGRRAVA